MATPLVLVVDNEDGLLVLFARLVQRLGCNVLQANQGQMAIDILQEQTPDLMILDLAMPQVSGFDVLRAIVDIPRLDAMRVMVLTATGPGPAPEDVNHRVDAWVTKPVLPTIFIEEVESLLGLSDE
ncbi:MAG: response regulator [Anaerolineae bacterium]|nr:response regulator [Anaerolineae bacterium]